MKQTTGTSVFTETSSFSFKLSFFLFQSKSSSLFSFLLLCLALVPPPNTLLVPAQHVRHLGGEHTRCLLCLLLLFSGFECFVTVQTNSIKFCYVQEIFSSSVQLAGLHSTHIIACKHHIIGRTGTFYVKSNLDIWRRMGLISTTS